MACDISVADERFHSRLNAKNKTYQYKIAYYKPDVFIRKYVYYTDKKPDVSLMKHASEKLLGTHDFIGFSSLSKSKKSTVRTINSIDIEDDGSIITITINGTGFLYNMVRIMVGTLIEVARGSLSALDLTDIINSCDRSRAGATAPPAGLYLNKVSYINYEGE